MATLSRFAFALILVLLSASVSYPCSCAEPSQRQRFRSANSVFLGEVVEVKDRAFDDNDEFKYFFYEVTFKIQKQWKGRRSSEITVWADFDMPGMCNGLDVSIGKRVLVYATKDKGHLLVYRDCGPSRSADYAKDEIKRLDNFLFRAYTFFYPFPKF